MRKGIFGIALLAPGISAALIAVSSIFSFTLAQTGFTVNGRAVSASTYQAYKLINESNKLMRQNKIVAANDQLKRALSLDPTLPEARGMYGITLARLGRIDQAAEQMRMAISGKPEALSARLNLASLCLSSGRLDEALEIYKKVVSDFPNDKIVDAINERITMLEAEQRRRRGTAADRGGDAGNYLADVTINGRKRWPRGSMPLRVYIYPGEGLPGWNDNYADILRSSFEEWQKASNGQVQFKFVGSSRDADISCTWVDNPRLLESSAEGGEAQVQSLAQSIVKCRILISLNDAESAFPHTENLVRTLCLHEIGHAIGLLGHSVQVADVMYFSTPIIDLEQHLSGRDKATLNALYATDVDNVSSMLAALERESKGNAINILRLGVVAVVTVLAATGMVWMIASKQRKNKKPRRKSV